MRGTVALIAGPASAAPVSAATSRAMPSTDIASPRLGVTFRSSTASSSSRYSRSAVPSGRIGGQLEDAARRSPPGPAPWPSTSMPCDSTPRSFARLDRQAHPGSVAPTVGQRALQSRARIGRAAHDLHRRSRAAAHATHLQLVGLRMRLGAQDLRHHHTGERRRCAARAPRARSRPWSGARRARARPRAGVTQSPASDSGSFMRSKVRNCLRKRRSLSKNSRRSLTP